MIKEKSIKEVIKEWGNPKIDNNSYDWTENEVRYIFGIKHVCKKDKYGQYRFVRVN